MIKQKRYLITTADELTWKFDQPVIFLGEWCRLYDRKHIWQKMNAIVAKPYGLEAFKKDEDYLNAKMLEKKLFPELCKLLNEYHNSEHDERVWKIIIGHWFRIIIKLLINRINTLEKCLQTEMIHETTLYNSEYSSLASPDIVTALKSYNNDQWNNVLNGRIISLLDNLNININFCKDSDYFKYRSFKSNSLNNNLSFKLKLFNFANKFYSKISKKFVKDEDALIINSYLPLKDEFRLELALKQWPQFWRSLDPKIDLKPDEILRKKLTKKFERKSENNLENIVRTLLFEILPVYYLEAQNDLKKIVEELPWPKSPKFIFTSNNFYLDEVFKLWTATKVESGIKYYVGQHGNNYFTRKNRFPRIEEETSDKFFTWGWTNRFQKYSPAFIFKTGGRKTLNHKVNGKLLLMEKSQRARIATYDTISEHDKYFKDQKKFVSKLDTEPRQNLIIRLTPNYKDTRYNEDLRWKDFDKSLNINKGNSPIRNLIKDSRLVVHSYDSTGILETFSQNIPTVAFWQDGFDHLRNSVKSDYKLLVDAGIFHLSAESIAEKINKIWDNIDEWWFQKSVQDAKTFFCNNYAKNSANPNQKLVTLLKKDLF